MTQPSVSVGTPAGTLSYERFLQENDEQHTEWVNGEVVAMAPASVEHQLTSSFLLRLLTSFVESRELGQVFYEPFNMKTGPDLPGRSPDILFVATAHCDRLRDTYLDGPADVVVEVVSPGSAGRDRGDKYFEYEAGGVREYWLIDPRRQVAEFYALNPSGRFELQTTADGTFRSSAVDRFWLDVAWLWDRPRLSDVEALLGLR
ncbi:MAG: hypothetical protein C0506_11715 [Anaerolinea sp.]|nr:hypothetical protein [Anaerolinea sp.]